MKLPNQPKVIRPKFGPGLIDPSRRYPRAADTPEISTDSLIQDNTRYSRKAAKREMIHALQVANAVEHIDHLPADGETHHCIMKGNYNAWDIVPAILRLADGAKILRLDVTTLGFNKDNASELMALHDAGKIGEIVFVCSCYFRDSTPEVFAYLREGVENRGQRVLAMRNHSKIILADLSDDRAIVVESSANLRSCHNVEQFTMTHDRGLLEFHRGWIEEMIQRGDQK